jgi:hypothetical protein
MFDRRHFLIGAAGSPLTAAFVRKAKICSLRNYEPLVPPPERKAEETLFINSGFRDAGSWRLSLGPIDVEAPPPARWREHLASLGAPLGTEGDIERVCNERDVAREDLDTSLNGFGWQDRWETSPALRRAHSNS